MKKILLSTIVVFVLVLAGLNFFAAGALYDSVQAGTRTAAGLEVKTVKIGDYTYTYADNNNTDKPTLLLIHGFTADKDNWARLAIFLRDDYRVIAPDLLGHGESPRDIKANYAISSQVARVHDFANALGLEKFHMAGNSMGGYITAMYAATYPDQLLSAILLDNAGVTMPNKSDMIVALDNNEPHPLIIRSTADVDRFFSYVFADAPFLTGSIKEAYATKSAVHAELYEKIFGDFHQKEYAEPLEPLLQNITAPVQIIWGGADRILDVSSIESMKPLLPNADIVVMPGVGHLPMLERPKETADVIHSFIKAL